MSGTALPILMLTLMLRSFLETGAIEDRETGRGKPSDFVKPPSDEFSGGFLVNLTDSKESDREKKDKKPRTAIPGPINLDLKGPACCASKHVSFSSPSRPSERHQPSRYDDRPEDRFGWQSYEPAKASSSSSSSSNSRPAERYPPRPSYGAPSKYGSGTSSNSGSTGGYGYGYGYGESSNSGYGSYGSRPGGGGGGGYGASPHGIYGSFGDGDEFVGGSQGEIPFPEAGPPMAPNNIQTQKAVALKALAGVALIGAAAALATNPVLLPLGLVAGRKKREAAAADAEFRNQFVAMVLQKVEKEKQGFAMSPKCVARLTCEIQKEYVSDLRLLDDGGQNDNVYESLERRFMYLIQNNVLNGNSVSPYLKKLIKFAITLGSSDRSCDVLRCNLAARN